MHERLPSIFVGHGSPMNAIATNRFVQSWKDLAKTIPRPKAILAISAHWFIPSVSLTANPSPETIHDFGGFPKKLFDTEYNAPGSIELVQRVKSLVPEARLEHQWGLDHGTWSVLTHMYPDADIPVIQLSIDSRKPDLWHYQLGHILAPLRDEGVLIMGSGNIVHNFGFMEWTLDETDRASQPWAQEWVDYVETNLNFDGEPAENPIVNWRSHKLGQKANPSPDHFLPLLYILGTSNGTEPITTFAEGFDKGTIAMTGVRVG